ncbi:MAG: LysR family transcriptional regulator [Pseudobutyrivibrio sp.]|nr:LysR family transcriptional regulator [Pseudobutyrivibrio sp.]
MEIKNLKYFLAVAREENMSKAAEQLHVSQPTLSKTLKALEDELGKKLFVRHSFSISLTDEGMLLRDRAHDLVAMADKIEQEFNTLDDITGGDIYFGLAESYQIRYLAREIYKLKEKYPNFTYHVTSGDTEQVTEKLDKGILDFAVLCETPNSNKYEYVKFPEADVWGAIMTSSHHLANKKSICVSDLVGEPLFVSEQSWNNEIKSWAKDKFPELTLEGSFRLSYNGSVFARENLGILLTFKDLINTEGTNMVFRPLSPALKSDLYLIWNKYQTFTPISEKFLEQIKETFK